MEKSVSWFLENTSGVWKGNRLSLVSKYVTSIGMIPENIQDAIEIAYLSNNSLSSLQGLEQFKNLRVLSIGNNLIQNVDELQALKVLKMLDTLYVVDNPCCLQPHFKYYVIHLLPQLKSIDSLTVSHEDRQKCKEIIQNDQIKRNFVFKNHMELILIQRYLQFMDIHTELILFVQSYFSDFIPDGKDFLDLRLFDSKRYLHICQQQQLGLLFLDPHIILDQDKKNIQHQLNVIVYQAHQKLASVIKDHQNSAFSWKKSYSEVVLCQQQEMTKIHQQCSLHSRKCHKMIKSLALNNDNSKGMIKSLVLNNDNSIKIIDEDKYSVQPCNNKENKSVQNNQKENKSVQNNKKENKSVQNNKKENKCVQNNQKENKCVQNNKKENKSEKEMNKRNLVNHHENKSLRSILPPQQLDPEEERGKQLENSGNKEKRHSHRINEIHCHSKEDTAWNKVRQSTKEAQENPDVHLQLQDKINLLQRDLQIKDDYIEELHHVIDALANRLEVYHKCNVLNAEEAARQIGQLQKRLQQQTKIREIESMELQQQNSVKMEYQRLQESYSNLVSDLTNFASSFESELNSECTFLDQ